MKLATIEQYISWLHTVEGFSLKDSKDIAEQHYKKQWGITSSKHREALERMWQDIDASNKAYYIRLRTQNH